MDDVLEFALGARVHPVEYGTVERTMLLVGGARVSDFRGARQGEQR